jgi:hypothetical protein
MNTATTKEMTSVKNERAFSLRFLKPGISIYEEQKNWKWTPYKPFIFNIKTATFSGKNKADDYTNE